MCKNEQDKWCELYEYVKCNIFEYKDKKLSKFMVLRLRGLRDGKFISSKHNKSLGSYDYDMILLTFKMCKFDITSILKTKEFKDEQHKVNYIMYIIENKINDTVDMVNRKNKSEEKGIKVEVANPNNEEKAKYKKKTNKPKSSELDNLW